MKSTQKPDEPKIHEVAFARAIGSDTAFHSGFAKPVK